MSEQIPNDDYNNTLKALDDRLFDTVKQIAEPYGASVQAVMIVSVITKEFKKLYKFFNTPEPILEIKRAIREWIGLYDGELGKKG